MGWPVLHRARALVLESVGHALRLRPSMQVQGPMGRGVHREVRIALAAQCGRAARVVRSGIVIYWLLATRRRLHRARLWQAVFAWRRCHLCERVLEGCRELGVSQKGPRVVAWIPFRLSPRGQRQWVGGLF